jgi:DNA repair protein RadC
MSTADNIQMSQTKSVYEFTAHQHATIREAIGILESSIKNSEAFTNSDIVKQYCQLQVADKRDEHFGCLFLDNQHRLIVFEELFNGTIDGAAVYPRVVVRRALEINAAAVIFTHNHPSGLPEPSQADIAITKRLREALALIDIRVLDHIVVGSEGTVSMAERGQI